MALALYHNDMSICSQKVRLVLAEKGRDWESRHLNLMRAIISRNGHQFA